MQFSLRAVFLVTLCFATVLAFVRCYLNATATDRAVNTLHSKGIEAEYFQAREGSPLQSMVFPYADVSDAATVRKALRTLNATHPVCLLKAAPHIHVDSAVFEGLSLPELEVICFRDVALRQPFWDLVTHSKHLRILVAENSGLTDRALHDITANTGIQALWIGRNDIDLTGITRASEALTVLRVNQTRVSNDGVARIVRLFPNLVALDLGGTLIDDDGLAAVGALSDLRCLGVSNTRITDRGVAHLCRLPNLSTLELRSASITADGLGVLAKHPRLTCILSNDPRHLHCVGDNWSVHSDTAYWQYYLRKIMDIPSE